MAIAAKPPESGKTRLAGMLTPAARAWLCRAMADHALTVATQVVCSVRCLLVSASPDLHELARSHGVECLSDEGEGLNAALAMASCHARSRGATALLTLSADLPWLGQGDLRAMLATDADVVIAADRYGTGTNALLLRPPGLIAYSHGEASLFRHRAESRRIGARLVEIYRPGLACDLDTPADLAPPFLGRFLRLHPRGTLHRPLYRKDCI
ncbi:2-phospho-L-lactate guanylyltransferase [Sphingobium aquiterrae]|uniref:2-phospho-L-lactate guanylyltransferase n=1 Tax=Sphingobium aquiterrae TaxID=2038656 RepID=UPI00301B2275